MKLDELYRGSVYIDTNILYMYLRVDPAHLSAIKVFLSRIVRGQIEAFVSIPVLDELFYRLLLARVREATDRNPLDVLRENQAEAIDAHSDVIGGALRKLTLLSHINLVGVDTTDFNRMLENIQTFSLLPRDALHVAIVQRLGLNGIASDDIDFDRVKGVERHWVINPPARTT
jgi:predicted nucleic acid-binding protein